MRILVVSDTHGKNKNLKRVIEKETPVDLMIHLGDFCGYADEIMEMAGCPVEMVAGNCDFFSTLEREKLLSYHGHAIFITHGNYYDVDSGIEDIKRTAERIHAELALFGHTHRPMIDYGNGLTILNPGSLSMPRQEGKRCSYAIVEFDKKGKIHAEIRFLTEK